MNFSYLPLFFLQNGLSANSATVRAAAASCAGRLCGCITEAESQALSEKVIALARTAVNRSVRAAAAAAVGAVQRARGATSSAAALPVLRALAQDTAAVELQVSCFSLILFHRSSPSNKAEYLKIIYQFSKCLWFDSQVRQMFLNFAFY